MKVIQSFPYGFPSYRRVFHIIFFFFSFFFSIIVRFFFPLFLTQHIVRQLVSPACPMPGHARALCFSLNILCGNWVSPTCPVLGHARVVEGSDSQRKSNRVDPLHLRVGSCSVRGGKWVMSGHGRAWPCHAGHSPS